jgi:hypothetical protein
MYVFLAALEFELRASHLLGWCSYWLALCQPFFVIGFFGDRVSQSICLGLALNGDPPDLCLLSS